MTYPRKEDIESLRGYVDNGANYWPGAHYFTLIGIGADGDSTGSGADVCRGCVCEVAQDALDTMFLQFKMRNKIGTVATCGYSHSYQLLGEYVSDGDGYSNYCSQCG